MSFSLPPIKPKPELHDNSHKGNNFEVKSLMTNGFTSSPSGPIHPLEYSEKNYYKNRNAFDMAILRNEQGLHAPLRIGMELKAASQIGRLPFLHSSNVMHDALTGRDLEIGPADLYNTAEFCEVSGQPHAMVEKSLGIL